MHYNDKKQMIPVVRAINQFGVMPKHPTSVRLFLDDARNPPLKEKGWVVVRTVKDAVEFMAIHGDLVTEISLDNDLGPDPQGYCFLESVLEAHQCWPFKQLVKFTIHTGNMPKWRLMVRMLRGSAFIVKRRVPTNLIYPRMSEDKRKIRPFRKGENDD